MFVRVASVCVALVLATGIAVAPVQSRGPARSAQSPALELQARLLDKHASAVIGEAALANMIVAEKYVGRGVRGKALHDEMRTLVANLSYIRAIIIIGPGGNLLYDSFRHPAAPLNLSDRGYFRDAQAGRPGAVYVAPPLVGRSSGVSFIPIAQRADLGDGQIAVIVSLIHPTMLINPNDIRHCGNCVAAILRADQKPLVTHPAGTAIPERFVSALDLANGPATGQVRTDLRYVRANAYWIRNQQFPIITIYSEITGN